VRLDVNKRSNFVYLFVFFEFLVILFCKVASEEYQ